MAFSDEDVAIGCSHDAARFGQGLRGIPSNSCRADRKQHLAIRAELDHDMALRLSIRILLALPIVGASAVDDPDIAVRIQINLVWENEQAGAETLQKFSG